MLGDVAAELGQAPAHAFVIKGMVDAVVVPLARWRKGKALIDANVKLFDSAVIEISLLGDGMPGVN